MLQKRFNHLLLLGVVATLCALAIPTYLPKKELVVLSPHIQQVAHLYIEKPEGNNARIEWVDQAKNKWRCAVEEQGHFICNYVLQLVADVRRGWDLSSYSAVKVKINYSGSASRIRFGLRAFDERFSKVEDANSGKYHFVILPMQDLNRELLISLNELTVADWWIMQYNLPRELARPDLSKVVSISAEFSDSLPPGNHDVYVESIVFIGDWIDEKLWYLGILAFWIILVVIWLLVRVLSLHLQTKTADQRINELADTNSLLQSEKNRFQTLSNLDSLTAILNRKAIDKKVEQLLAEPKRSSIALIMVDIDYFKQVNDQRGHDAGDRVLKEFVEIVGCKVRGDDIFGRWGGEEFILVCPKTTIDNAYYLAEKIRGAIAGHVFEEDNPLTLSASFGIATIQQHEDFKHAFKRVDAALYAAKARGRNCTVIAEVK